MIVDSIVDTGNADPAAGGFARASMRESASPGPPPLVDVDVDVTMADAPPTGPRARYNLNQRGRPVRLVSFPSRCFFPDQWS
jgi:hypothetical protein